MSRVDAGEAKKVAFDFLARARNVRAGALRFASMLLADTHSIRRNVMVVVLTTTFAALILAAAAMLVYEARNYRQSSVTNLQAQAELVSATSAPALAFDDRKAAQESLNLLRIRRDIVSAVLYTDSGEPYATYSRDTGFQSLPVLPDWTGSRYAGEHVEVVHRIVENGVLVGTLYLRAQFDLLDRLFGYLAILGAVILGSLLVALLISSRLQRVVTRPILALAEAAHTVVERRDFSLRVPETSKGEIGVLIDAFNTMLLEIGKQTQALQESNQVLKQESTDRAAAEAALRVADRRKDEFLATLAHELRNPLAPMANALAILRTAPLDASLSRIREMMERQLKQMVRLVDDLLDVSRITTGKLNVRREAVDLASTIRSAVDTTTPLIEARGHRLSLDLPDIPILLYADSIRLAQVIANLLNNAAKYTDPNGEIGLSVTVEGKEAVITVRDNGIGIAADMLPQVFDMFRQADNSIERVNAGLGVGLTLAQRLVELHGGSITASSAGLGQGSEFVVRLPIIKAEPAGAPAKASSHSSGSNIWRILVVDDNQDFAETLATLLRQLGHTVLVAHDGQQALQQAPAFEPHFAFLDIGLPGMNGYDLARRMRTINRTANTVLIAATGYGQESDREQARNAGFDRHMVKPVELTTVRSILDAYAERAAQR
jgi:signal transduction histidine kinase/ActR/RegA family two-component response regulator